MIQEINRDLQAQIKEISTHDLYKKLSTPEHLQNFMEHHVFAVWDFMSLLTALQERFTKTTNPWMPIGDPETRYLINQIVLAKETDTNYYGKHQSHFEMYLDAMNAAGADTKKITDFLLHVTHGTDIFLIIAASKLPVSIKQFIKTTFDVISEGQPHKIAAALTFGRQGLIPETFNSKIVDIQKHYPKEDLKLVKYYFDRNTALERNEHSSMAFRILENLCGNDQQKWQEARETAEKALQSRIELWNGIEYEIEESLITKKTG